MSTIMWPNAFWPDGQWTEGEWPGEGIVEAASGDNYRIVFEGCNLLGRYEFNMGSGFGLTGRSVYEEPDLVVRQVYATDLISQSMSSGVDLIQTSGMVITYGS